MSKYTGLTPAQHEANKRYIGKTYKIYTFYLRNNEDSDIIQSIADAQEQGLNKREWLRELYELANKK